MASLVGLRLGSTRNAFTTGKIARFALAHALNVALGSDSMHAWHNHE